MIRGIKRAVSNRFLAELDHELESARRISLSTEDAHAMIDEIRFHRFLKTNVECAYDRTRWIGRYDGYKSQETG